MASPTQSTPPNSSQDPAPPSRDSSGTRKLFPIAAVVLGFGLFFALGFASRFGLPSHRSAPTIQPVEFNHRLHVEQPTLSCVSCHEFTEQTGLSHLPRTELCTYCHLTPQGEGAKAAALMERLKSGEQLEWKPLFRQPPQVFFPHRRHVKGAELECTRCHGNIGDSTAPPRRVTKLTMQQCLDCHEAESVRRDCTTCHR